MSKLTKIFFGRRTLAIVVAIVMVLQLLPFATLADDANDASDADVSTEDVVTVDPAVAESGEETVIDEISEDPAEPTDPENPENPAEPADPENPVNPEEPVEPAEPADPEEPVEPADPENPVNPEEPVEPAEPVDPEEPVAEPETEEAGNQVFTSGKVTVTGYLPVGGDVTVAPVNAGISPQMAPSPDGSTGAKSQKVLASYDIKIVDSEGAEWPLQERVQVTVRLDGGYTGPVKVYHYRVADGNCIGTYQAVGGEVTFPASSFSVYILVQEEDEDPETGITVTYNFYVGETLFNTEILRNGDTIVDPGLPTLAPNTTFHGWFDESNQQIVIGSTVESTETKTIKVSAKIVATYYVTFYGQDGEIVQVKEVLLETGETSKVVDTTDVAIIPKLDTQSFKGWSTTEDGTASVTSVTVTNSNIQLYPIITKSFWIRFDENDGGTGGGASYTGPVAVEEGQLAIDVKPSDPTRTGYRFDGWYTDQACTSAFNWNSQLTDHQLLYAKWTPVNTKYTVVFWQQKATDTVGMADAAKSYDYYDSVERTALTGTEVQITNADTRRGGTTGSAMGFYFTYNGTRSDTDAAIVLGDGSTVLNVYYDRKVITFNFYTYGGLFTGWELVKTLTGLYRSSVNAADWPNPGSNNYWYESSSGDSAWYTTPLLVYAVPGEDAATEQNLYARESDDHGNGKNITFLGQDTSGNYSITLHQEKLYRNQVYRLNDEYLGFTVYKYNTNGNNINSASDATPATTISYDDIDKNNGAYVYYTRNIWTLKFHSNNEDVKTEDVYYQADLSEYGTFVPTNGPVGHRFAGWYADPAFGTEFDFDTTMINASVTVYAKWEKLRYHIHLDPNDGELYGTQIADFYVDFEETLDRTSLENSVRRENWVLVGWFDEATGKAYAYGKVTSDVNLIAKWRFPGLVKVEYDAGENGTNPPSDNGNYSGASTVVVGRPSDANPGYMFVGWKIQGVENSANYLPNDIFEIPNEAIVIDPNNHDRGTVTLVADYLLLDLTVFGKTSVTFDPNGGSGSAVTVSGVQINESFEAAAASAAGTLEGYTFIGWSKTQKTTGYTEDDVFCQAGATLFADNEDLPNTLYAAWKINTYTVKFDANGGTGTAMADEIYEYNEEKALTKNTYTLEGYEFLGWSTDPNATSAEYDDEQVVKNLTELVKTQDGAVVTLYAVWKLSIIEVTAKVEDKTVDYNGETQYGNTEVTFEGLAEGHTATIEYKPSEGKDADTYDNGEYTLSSFKVVDGEGNDVTDQYTLGTTTKGKLIITKPSATAFVEPWILEKVYDGTPLVGGITVTGIDPSEIHAKYSFKWPAYGSDYSTEPASLIDATDGRVMYAVHVSGDNFTPGIVFGYLTIKKAPLTITVNDQSYAYNGKAQGEDNATYTAEADITEKVTAVELKGGDKLTSITLNGQETAVGEYEKKIVASDGGVVYGHETDKTLLTDNYNVTYVAGKLTITAADLTITINDASKVYGDADPELTYTAEGLLNGETIPEDLITIWRDAGEDVGTYPIHGKIGPKTSIRRMTFKPVKAGSTFDVNNYNITINEGTFEITPAEVTVTADSFTKKQGEADPTFTAKVTGLVNGDDESVITYTLSREAGEEPGTYAITPTGEATQGNYKVIFVPGKLTIKEKDKEIELGEFSLMWVSDTLLKGEGAYDDAFKAIVDYAEKNAKAFGTIAMISTGNLVDAFDNEAAWNSAKNSLKDLTKVQFFSVAGTKDVNGDEMSYDAYLAAKLSGRATSYKDGSIWYRSFGSKNLMLVGIGYQKIAETDEEKDRQNKWLAFVNETIAVHRSEKVILILNDYMDATGELTPFGKLIEEKVVEGNKNVIMVLCGNANGAVHKEMTYGERKVAVAMFNYAADEENGLGLVRIITINPMTKAIEIQTIDAIEGKARAYDPMKPEEDSFRFEDLF